MIRKVVLSAAFMLALVSSSAHALPQDRQEALAALRPEIAKSQTDCTEAGTSDKVGVESLKETPLTPTKTAVVITLVDSGHGCFGNTMPTYLMVKIDGKWRIIGFGPSLWGLVVKPLTAGQQAASIVDSGGGMCSINYSWRGNKYVAVMSKECQGWIKQGVTDEHAAELTRAVLAGTDPVPVTGTGAMTDLTSQQATALSTKAASGNKTALKRLTTEAQQTNKYAQFELGLLYAKGRGVSQDYVQAAQWYRKAAEQKNFQAQNNLGNLYALGQGVPQNSVVAYALFTLVEIQNVENNPGAFDINLSQIAEGNKNRVSTGMTNQEVADGQTLTGQIVRSGNLLKTLDAYLARSAGR